MLLCPPHPTVAPFHCQPLAKPFNFLYSGIFSVLGLPVTSVPVGLSREGMPLGIQVRLNDQVIQYLSLLM